MFCKNPKTEVTHTVCPDLTIWYLFTVITSVYLCCRIRIVINSIQPVGVVKADCGNWPSPLLWKRETLHVTPLRFAAGWCFEMKTRCTTLHFKQEGSGSCSYYDIKTPPNVCLHWCGHRLLVKTLFRRRTAHE